MPTKFMDLKGSPSSRSTADTPELQALASRAVEEATIRRWRYMNNIYWYALHGKEDDTPTLPASHAADPERNSSMLSAAQTFLLFTYENVKVPRKKPQ